MSEQKLEALGHISRSGIVFASFVCLAFGHCNDFSFTNELLINARDTFRYQRVCAMINKYISAFSLMLILSHGAKGNSMKQIPDQNLI